MKHTLSTAAAIAMALLLACLPAYAEGTAAPGPDASAMAAALPFDQAITLAQGTHPDWALVALSLDNENDTLVYEAELVNPADGTKAEVQLNAVTGEMIAQGAAGDNAALENADDTGDDSGEAEAPDNGQDSQKQENGGNEQDVQEQKQQANADDATEAGDMLALLAQATVTLPQAGDTALAAYPGAFITEIELEDENGLPVFGVTLSDAQGQPVEVKVDAVSNAIVPEDNASAEN